MENKKAVAVENAAEDTIDLLEIFRALYRRWVWIVFVALVFGIALGMYGKFVVKDVTIRIMMDAINVAREMTSFRSISFLDIVGRIA